jgi:hypothetical protein
MQKSNSQTLAMLYLGWREEFQGQDHALHMEKH